MKFVILSPRQIGGGPIVLHILCRELIKRGYDAKILYIPGLKQKQSKFIFWTRWMMANGLFTFRRFAYEISRIFMAKEKAPYADYFRSPVKGTRRKWLPFISDDTIVVYPDIVYGNVLNAKKVVRYLLYFNAFKGDESAYDVDDLFFCYRDIFNDSELNPDVNTMCLQHFDFDLYRDYDQNPRNGCCYILRKGKNRSDVPEKLDGPVIDDWSESEKVRAFNTYKYCYIYDTQTFYTAIASVCGCIPIVVLEPGKKKDDYLATGENPVGVAFGDTPENIEYAVRTRHELIQNLKMFEQWNDTAVDHFIDVCGKYFEITWQKAD